MVEPTDLEDLYFLLVLKTNSSGDLLKEDDQKGAL